MVSTQWAKVVNGQTVNEAVEKRSFWVRFSGVGTLYVPTPGELYIRGKSKVPPEAAHDVVSCASCRCLYQFCSALGDC